MIKDAKVYECNICGRKETVEIGYEPDDIVHFELYDLKPCICRRCLKLAVNASNAEKKKATAMGILCQAGKGGYTN